MNEEEINDYGEYKEGYQEDYQETTENNEENKIEGVEENAVEETESNQNISVLPNKINKERILNRERIEKQKNKEKEIELLEIELSVKEMEILLKKAGDKIVKFRREKKKKMTVDQFIF